MRKIAILYVAVALWVVPAFAYDLTLQNTPVQVYFSPRGGAQDALVATIGQAKDSIFVQAYSFTSAPIAKALVDAVRRGVKIEAILDKSQRTERYTGATFLKNEGIPVYIDDKHAIAHNKVMILDRSIVVTGSFNFTKAAEEKNAENLLIIPSKDMAKIYMDNWEKHKEHSESY
ncbi:phospholipase D family protein [Solidesulfovibrio alcoholivorans]|uniref:phospholipase D family nuclease n=1 Tax=Solidesulfovibrio alcoholivorans TaxID=81406 RepID=UPI0004969278|nr:phospholipase D family protein [Solidesulfovibrio alcoholivorans]